VAVDQPGGFCLLDVVAECVDPDVRVVVVVVESPWRAMGDDHVDTRCGVRREDLGVLVLGVEHIVRIVFVADASFYANSSEASGREGDVATVEVVRSGNGVEIPAFTVIPVHAVKGYAAGRCACEIRLGEVSAGK
jgi:hypothetical protein